MTASLFPRRKAGRPPTVAVPTYTVRLVPGRPLRVAEAEIDSPLATARVLHALIGRTDREHFVALFVNAAKRITGAHVAAIGGQGHCDVEVRTIFRAALAACAAAVVVGHNHPSGDVVPSAQDMRATRGLVRAGDVLGVAVLDHVIVTLDEDRHFSMFSRGVLPSVSESWAALADDSPEGGVRR